MPHACTLCGSAPEVQAWASPSERADAAADLRRQADEASEPLATILRSMARAEEAQDEIGRIVADNWDTITIVLAGLLIDVARSRPGVPLRRAMREAGLDDRGRLSEVVEGAGVGDIRREVLEPLAVIIDEAEVRGEAGRVVPPTPAPEPAGDAEPADGATPRPEPRPRPKPDAGEQPPRPPRPEVIREAEKRIKRLLDDHIAKPLEDVLEETVESTPPGEDAESAAQRLKDAAGRRKSAAVTESVTAAAEIDRAITMLSAELSDADWLYYGGPVDGITRPFCAELAGFAFRVEDAAELNNGQTATHPFISGGGYRCRHHWSPLSDGARIALDVPEGTRAMVKAANLRAARRR